MSQETHRIEIPINVTDKTSAGTESAQENLNGFDKSIESTRKHLEDTEDTAQKAGKGIRDVGESGRSSASDLASLAVQVAAVAATYKELVTYLYGCAEASMVFQSAMTGIAKTSDLSDQQLAQMADDIQALSERIPVTTTELAGIGEVAGQLGIDDSNLLNFTEVMANLATATTMTADDAATMLAQFANITQMDESEYENLASAIVDLGNNYATTEQRITEMSQGIAASASLANMSESEMVGLSAAVTSLGIDTQAGATSMSMLIANISKAVETGEGLTEIASTANMSASDFSQAWGKDAAGALVTFIQGLNDTERNGQSASLILDDLGLTETRLQRMTLSLANSGDLLTNAINTANTAWEEDTALQVEAEKRYGTTQSQLTMMQDAYNNLKIAIGDAYTPALEESYSAGADVLSQSAEFIERNPKVVQAVTTFVGILGSAILVLTAYAAVAKLAAAASALLTASIPGVGIIMAVVGAVAALTAATILRTDAETEEEKEIKSLTASSRQQYNELQDLKTQYDITCDIMGETSYEAQKLKWQVDDLSESYEANKQTQEDLSEEHENLMKQYEDQNSEAEEARSEISKQAQSITSLINELETLSSTTAEAKDNQSSILAIIEALNTAVPNLSLSYEDVINQTPDFISSLRKIAEAQIAKEDYEANWSDYVSKVKSSSEYENHYKQELSNYQAALDEYNQQKIAYNEKWQAQYEKYLEHTSSESEARSLTNLALEDDAKVVDDYENSLNDAKTSLDEAESAYRDNESAISDLERTMSAYDQSTQDSSDTTGTMTESIIKAKKSVEELIKAYDAAYDAAYDSISGQYGLWDEADEVTTSSISDINKAMQSQIDYWNNYSGNLNNLMGRNIPGLDEMLASMDDGSAKSAGMLAGMVGASDEDIASLVAAYQQLKTAQGNTAKNVADLGTNFSTSMDNVLKSLETTVSEMNLSSDAEASAYSTMQAYIDTFKDASPEAYQAAQAIAQAAMNGLSSVTGGSTEGTTAHADGGIFSSPHKGLVAEDGAEGIIPLSTSRRSRGLDLWRQTGKILGADVPVTVSASGIGTSVTVTVAANPAFTIQADSDTTKASILSIIKANIKEMSDDIGNEIADKLAKIFADMPVKG